MGPWSPRPHGLQPTNWRPLAVGAPPQTHTVQGPHSAPCAPEHKVYASLISMSGRKRVGGVSGTHTWRNTTILGTPQPSAPSPEWGFEKYEEPGRVCLPLRVPPVCSNRPGHGASPLATPMTYNVTYLMFDAIYQVQTFAMLFSSGDLNECEVRSVRFVARDWTLWPGVGQSVAIRPVKVL
jgi:hypothetical protein